MVVSEKIKYRFKPKDIFLPLVVIKEIRNWLEYFLDIIPFPQKEREIKVFHTNIGLKYAVRRNTTDRGVITRIHIADDYKIKRIKLKPNATIVDIGAHIGIFSLIISKISGKIYAYEPVEENYKMLLKNIELNNLSEKITPFKFAVSDINGFLDMGISSYSTVSHSFYLRDSKSRERVVSVTLKNIFDDNKIEYCDLIKIDTEGLEKRIIFGLPPEYFKKIERIYFENHNLNNSSNDFEEIKLLLISNGFSISGSGEIVFATKKA